MKDSMKGNRAGIAGGNWSWAGNTIGAPTAGMAMNERKWREFCWLWVAFADFCAIWYLALAVSFAHLAWALGGR